MQDIKQTVAQNISELRRSSGMTQIDLAEKLNYTDKAVSKWERAESIPDVTVLKKISELFGVTVDHLLSEKHEGKPKERVSKEHTIILLLSLSFLILTATAVYVMFLIFAPQIKAGWLSYVYLIPVSMIDWLVFNTIWFNRRRNYLIISLLMWTVLGAVQISFLVFDVSVLPVFLLAVPGQIIILLWSRLKKPNSKKKA